MKRSIDTVLKSQISSTHMAAYLTKKSALLFLGLAFFGATPSMALTVPESDEYYPGASLAFVAMDPYYLNINGTSAVYTALSNTPRTNDFGGIPPFVNPRTGKADPAQFIYWNGGEVIQNGDQIDNNGAPGRVDKQVNMGAPATRVRYIKNDGMAASSYRTHVNSYAVPPRTHVRWDLNVAFGTGGSNDPDYWTLTPTGSSPVLFWELKSSAPGNPPLAAIVDTDSNDPSKLMIFFSLKVGSATSPIRIAEIHNLSRNTYIPISIEAFLDERATASGGKGALKIWVNNLLVQEMTTPTLLETTDNTLPTHIWSMAMYLYNQTSPSLYTRASFWKTAKMIVFPKPD